MMDIEAAIRALEAEVIGINKNGLSDISPSLTSATCSCRHDRCGKNRTLYTSSCLGTCMHALADCQGGGAGGDSNAEGG
jgi:hypothetical protein